MPGNIQKLSIRLLKANLEPENALRERIDLEEWPKIKNATIALGTTSPSPPQWANFLELSHDERQKLQNSSAYGLVFLKTSAHWFAISFGMGHVQLDSAAFEQDFGLRVRSADIREPEKSALSRQSQISHSADPAAFTIDIESEGTPKDKNFTTRVIGSDTLAMDRRLKVTDLPEVCDEAFVMYSKAPQSLLHPEKKINSRIKNIIHIFLHSKEISDILALSLKPNIIFNRALFGIVASAYPTYHVLMLSNDCTAQKLYAAASINLRFAMAFCLLSLYLSTAMLAFKRCNDIVHLKKTFLRYSGLIHIIVPISLIFSATSLWWATEFIGKTAHFVPPNSHTCSSSSGEK